MTHDLRQALGYRPLPTSDRKEQRLRNLWYRTRSRLLASYTPENVNPDHSDPDLQRRIRRHAQADRMLSEYLWNRTLAEIEEDRKRHPKARRNAPAVRNPENTRYLP